MPTLEAEPQIDVTSSSSEVDLEELAREIFEIFLRELMLENERTGR